jgi:hypothetical protein
MLMHASGNRAPILRELVVSQHLHPRGTQLYVKLMDGMRKKKTGMTFARCVEMSLKKKKEMFIVAHIATLSLIRVASNKRTVICL